MSPRVRVVAAVAAATAGFLCSACPKLAQSLLKVYSKFTRRGEWRVARGEWRAMTPRSRKPSEFGVPSLDLIPFIRSIPREQ